MDLQGKIKLAIRLLKAQERKIAFAESVTGGFLGYSFAIAKDSGKVFLGSIATYDVGLKEQLLGVEKSLIEECTPESKEVTQAMVKGLMKLVKPDVGVAITGLCSEGGSETETKPVGSIFVAISLVDQIHDYRFVVSGSPDEIVKQATEEIVGILVRLLSS